MRWRNTVIAQVAIVNSYVRQYLPGSLGVYDFNFAPVTQDQRGYINRRGIAKSVAAAAFHFSSACIREIFCQESELRVVSSPGNIIMKNKDQYIIILSI